MLPVLLGGQSAALAEIANVLRGCKDLDAIHVIVHGRPGEPPTAFHAGKLKPPDKGRAVFSDGSVLAVAPGVAIPAAGRQATARIDVGTHRIRSFSVTG